MRFCLVNTSKWLTKEAGIRFHFYGTAGDGTRLGWAVEVMCYWRVYQFMFSHVQEHQEMLRVRALKGGGK